MNLRIAEERDKPRLEELYKKIPCPFPELREMLPIICVVDENDLIVQAVGCIPTVEVILFIDNKWETPGMRMEAFKLLHEKIREMLLIKGFVQAHAVIHPRIAKSFARRLKKMGWFKSKWPLFSRRANG